MGRIAAQCVLNRPHGTERYREQIVVEPGLLVRESAGMVSTTPSTGRRENKKPAKAVGSRGDYPLKVNAQRLFAAQSAHGVDGGSAPCGNEAGDKRDEHENQGRRHQCEGIAGIACGPGRKHAMQRDAED
jgi:hypothetical protein